MVPFACCDLCLLLRHSYATLEHTMYQNQVKYDVKAPPIRDVSVTVKDLGSFYYNYKYIYHTFILMVMLHSTINFQKVFHKKALHLIAGNVIS